MELLDQHIRSGKISNWLISEGMGALYRALRFLYGNGGLIQQFCHCVFNDGWWHECSVGYNTWVSSMMIHTTHAMLPFGYHLVHTYFQASCSKEVSAVYADSNPQVLPGMYNQKRGGNTSAPPPKIWS